MVQESTIICVDNSEYMRNGDFVPTRLQAQQDAANLVLQCKLRSNPENAVGVLSMADKVEVLATLTQDNSKLFMKLHQIQPNGESKFISGMRVAHLALKHRQNRNHKMRIVFFIGSPMCNVDPNELLRQAKKLKKEKVQMDVVCFGEADSDNSDKLTAFIDMLNGREGTGSHLVVVASGSTLTEALVSSPVCRGEDGAAIPVTVPGSGSAAGYDYGGVDPSADPELAMALRVSLEEQRQRMEQEGQQQQQSGGQEVMDTGDGALASVQSMVSNSDPSAMTEEEQLEWALRMSIQDSHQTQQQETVTAAAATISEMETTEMESMMAVGENDNNEGETTADVIEPQMERDDENEEEDAALGQLMNDPEMLRELVAGLPGVDPNSPIITDAISQQAASKKKTKDEKKEEKKDDKEDDGQGTSAD